MRLAASGLALAALAGAFMAPALAEPQRRPGPGTANPSALIAAELAFARLAREKGQWTAFRETAAEEAVMFDPRAVRAKDWLKGRKDPPQAVAWQPYKVWMSCDGSLGATTGAWQRPDGSAGYFTTIWKRQKKGSFRWVLDHGASLDKPLDAPDMVEGKVASCKARPEAAAADTPPADAADFRPGASQDRTLTWNATVRQDGSRVVDVRLWNGTGYDLVLHDTVAAGS